MIKHVGTIQAISTGERVNLVYIPERNEVLKGVITTTDKATYTISVNGVDTFIEDFKAFDSLKVSPNDKVFKIEKELGLKVDISVDTLYKNPFDIFFVTEIKK